MSVYLSAGIKQLHDLFRFTGEDEARERQELTPEDIAQSEADVLGMLSSSMASQCRISPQDKEEGGEAAAAAADDDDDDDVLTDALYMLDAELGRVPVERKAALMQAQERCPEQVGDDVKALFLRRDGFDVQRAAQRIVDYWEYKRKLFGPANCYEPLTLRGALQEDMAALYQGLVRVLPTTDAHGRAMVLFDPSRHDSSKYSRDSMLRAIWYTLTTAIEGTSTEGSSNVSPEVVLLIFPKYARFDQFDVKQFGGGLELEEKYLPIRFPAVHLCHPDLFFHIISPIFKGLLGKRRRQRLKIHYGTEEAVLQNLAGYGIPRDRLPTCLGGVFDLDHAKWLGDRYKIEEAPDRMDQCSPDTASASSLAAAHLGQGEPDNRMNECSSDAGPASSQVHLGGTTPIQMANFPGMPCASPPAQDVMQPMAAAAGGTPIQAANFPGMPSASPPAQDMQPMAAGGGTPMQTANFPSMLPRASPPAQDRQPMNPLSSFWAGLFGTASVGGSSVPVSQVATQPFVPADAANVTSVPTLLPQQHEQLAIPSALLSQNEPLATDAVYSRATATVPLGGPNSSLPPIVGRKGDPRMTKALKVKLENPHMSLLDSLLDGGFVFPALGSPGATDKTVRDSDGVTLHQRKNQLNRRLRKMKKKEGGSGSEMSAEDAVGNQSP